MPRGHVRPCDCSQMSFDAGTLCAYRCQRSAVKNHAVPTAIIGQAIASATRTHRAAPNALNASQRTPARTLAIAAGGMRRFQSRSRRPIEIEAVRTPIRTKVGTGCAALLVVLMLAASRIAPRKLAVAV